MDTGELAPDEFAAAVIAVTTAFGDPTRRDIYLYVRAAPDGVKAAVATVADALTAHGFAAHAESRGSALTLVAEHCPFGDAARQYPHVLCAVDTGMVKGMLEGLYGETSPMITESRPGGDQHCVTRV